MPKSSKKDANQIEHLIADGKLEDAHARFREFLLLCEEERDVLLQNQARFSSLRQAEMLGIRDGNTYDQNKILWDFVTQMRRFRKEVLTKFFDIRDREQFFSNISDRDNFMREILSIRINPKNYSIDAMLVEGNSSIVYRLLNHVLNRHAIASVLKIPNLNDKAIADIRTLTDLKHRNIIQVIDHDLSSFPYFVISEFIHGSTLEVALETTGPRPASQAADWLYQLTDALDYLRSKRIFHTNVRPSKIFVDEEGQMMVSPLDMHTVRGGEPTFNRYLDVCRYGSPEALEQFGQLLPDSLDDHTLLKNMCISDQYSLGVMGFEILTGAKLFAGNSITAILEDRRRFGKDKRYRKGRLDALPNLDFFLNGQKKTSLRKILEKLLEEAPARRYSDLHELLSVLHPFTRAQFHQQRPAANSYRRCLATNRQFIGDFYKAFFHRSSEAEKDFRELGKKRQLVMLQMAIDLLLDLDQQAERFGNILGNNQHQKYGMLDFEVFIDVLLEKVKQHDPLYNELVAKDWQSVRDQAMEVIHQSLSRTQKKPNAS